MSGRPVVVLAAMPRELRPLVRSLRLRPAAMFGLPAWHADRVLAVAVGVGPARAEAGAAQVLRQVEAGWVLVTGVAGAIDPSLGVGDLVRPAAVVDVESGIVRTPNAPSTSTSTSTGGTRTGLLATVQHVHLQSGGPAGGAPDAGLPAGATAVDMETAAIAAVCEARGVPWDVARAVSDVPGTLTREVAALLLPDGRTDLAGAARLVLHDPRVLGRLVRVGFDTARAVRAANRVIVAELAADAGGRPAGRPVR